MQKIEAVLQLSKLDVVKDALVELGISGMTITVCPRPWPAEGPYGVLPRTGVFRRIYYPR